MSQRESRKISESSLVSSHTMNPQDANPQGNVHGGAIMKLVDDIAGSVATLHSRKPCVTASIDQMNFYEPVFIGNLLVLRASVNYVGHTSLEVGVRIEARDLMTGKTTHTGSSYLTMVALDENRKPSIVPDIIPESEAEKRRYAEAKERRARRLAAVGKK